MEAKNKLSIEEQLRVAAAGAAPKGGGNYKSFIQTESDKQNAAKKQEEEERLRKEQEEKERKEEEARIAEERRKEERLRKEQEEQVRRGEEARIAEEKRKEEERLASTRNSAQNYNDRDRIESLTIVDPSTRVYSAPESLREKPVYKAPEVVTSGPFGSPVSTYSSPNSSRTEIETITLIVKVSDAYRQLEPNIQNTIKQFIKVDKNLTLNANDLGLIINGLMNVSQAEQEGMNDLVSLKEEERTSRAFTLISLPDSRLAHLHNLTLLFNQNYNPRTSLDENRIMFCRELETGIESLDVVVLKHLRPIDRLLSIVRGE